MNTKQPTNAEIRERHLLRDTGNIGTALKGMTIEECLNETHKHCGILLERLEELEAEIHEEQYHYMAACEQRDNIKWKTDKRIAELEGEATRSHRVNQKTIKGLKKRPTRSYHAVVKNKLSKAESRIAELEAKLEAAATTQRVCDVIEWLGTQCTNSQAVKALIKALEDKS